MTLCTPPCLHQDYCAHYGCPFMREPSSSFVSSFATKDGAEPSIRISSDAGAVPAISTNGDEIGSTAQGRLKLYSAGPAVIGQTTNCERQSVRCRTAPRGVSEAAPAESVATESRHLFQFGCVPTGLKLFIMLGGNANAQNGPQSHDLIVRGDVTAASFPIRRGVFEALIRCGECSHVVTHCSRSAEANSQVAV